MTSFEKAQKAGRKKYKERSQPENRSKFGLLEKKKDYKLRATDFQQKRTILNDLKEKARFRNPDEFYFGMINRKTKKGVHILQRNEKLSGDLLKIVNGQNLKYVQLIETIERNKINNLCERLQTIKSHNEEVKHKIFVDNKKEAKNFDPMKYFNTDDRLIEQTFNRPTKELLKTFTVDESYNNVEMMKHEEKSYKKLVKRINRLEQLTKAKEELQTRKNLLGKEPSVVVGKDSMGNDVYQWKAIRKR